MSIKYSDVYLTGRAAALRAVLRIRQCRRLTPGVRLRHDDHLLTGKSYGFPTDNGAADKRKAIYTRNVPMNLMIE